MTSGPIPIAESHPAQPIDDDAAVLPRAEPLPLAELEITTATGLADRTLGQAFACDLGTVPWDMETAIRPAALDGWLLWGREGASWHTWHLPPSERPRSIPIERFNQIVGIVVPMAAVPRLLRVLNERTPSQPGLPSVGPVIRTDLELLQTQARQSLQPTIDPLLKQACTVLTNEPYLDVAGLAQRLATSDRHLRRLFVDGIGLTPVMVLRLARVCRLLQRYKRDQALSNLAVDVGYADQAHMNREVKNATGLTASRWFKNAMREPAAMCGCFGLEMKITSNRLPSAKYRRPTTKMKRL